MKGHATSSSSLSIHLSSIFMGAGKLGREDLIVFKNGMGAFSKFNGDMFATSPRILSVPVEIHKPNDKSLKVVGYCD